MAVAGLPAPVLGHLEGPLGRPYLRIFKGLFWAFVVHLPGCFGLASALASGGRGNLRSSATQIFYLHLYFAYFLIALPPASACSREAPLPLPDSIHGRPVPG